MHNSAFKERIQLVLKDLIAETRELSLSTTNSAIKRLSNEEFVEMKTKRQAKDKLIEDVLKPIQQCIIRDFGSNTASPAINSPLICDT